MRQSCRITTGGKAGELKEVIGTFINYYNYKRYHDGREETKSRKLQARRDYNRTVREQVNGC